MMNTHDFVSNFQKQILEAPNGEAAVAALPNIFDRDLELHLNGEVHGWDWLEEHVFEVYKRLKNVEVTVTHAAREGSVLVERHTIDAIDKDSNEPWRMEVMSAFDLTADNKIKTAYELAHIRIGKYEGGW